MNQNLLNVPKSEHKYKVSKVDTDAITIYREDQDMFSEEECSNLLNELNSWLPEKIKLEFDGLYKAKENSEYTKGLVVVKSKNYITNQDGKIKFKGSSLIDQKREVALLEMVKKIGHSLLNGINYPELEKIYLEYIKESQNVIDITRWAVKKTVTKPVLESETDPDARTNEIKVMKAIKHLNPQEGDKVYVYDAIDGMVQAVEKGELVFKKDGEPKMIPNKILKTIDQYNNDTIPAKLVKRVFDTISIFDTIFTPMVEINVAKKDLKLFNPTMVPSGFVENTNSLKKGVKLTLDLLHSESVSFIEYIRQFPQVKIREISRFKGLVGEMEEE